MVLKSITHSAMFSLVVAIDMSEQFLPLSDVDISNSPYKTQTLINKTY